MTRGYLGIVCIALVLSQAPADAAMVKPGKACSKLGKKIAMSGKRYTCIRRDGRLLWNAGVRIARPTPSATPTLDLRQVRLSWTLTPMKLSDPGVLVDPDAAVLQDEGLNSSIALVATVNGRAVGSVPIDWMTSDATASVQAWRAATDASGSARAWLIAGRNDALTVQAMIPGTEESVTVLLQRATPIHATLNRPVIAGFVPVAGEYDRVSVEATPNTAPVGTFYAFANFANFYTGLQSVSCNGWDMYSQICSSERGQYVGREAHFSVWDGKAADGTVLRPVVVSLPHRTKCSPFDHEGSGQMCFAALDWAISERVSLEIRKLAGAPMGYARLRVEATLAASGRVQELATIDVPGGVTLNAEFAAFNENYLLNQYPSCLDGELRSITINRVWFIKADGTQVAPAKMYGYGNVVEASQSLCMNFGWIPTADGLEVYSGGSRWAHLADAVGNPSAQQRFQDVHQARIHWQWLPLGALA